MAAKIFEIERATPRKITADDGEFIFDLLNYPSFFKYIGDATRRIIRADDCRSFFPLIQNISPKKTLYEPARKGVDYVYQLSAGRKGI